MSRSLVCLAVLATACTDLPASDNNGDPGEVSSETQSTPELTSSTGEPPSATETERLDSVWQVTERFLTLDECGMESWLEDQELGQVDITGDLIVGFEMLHNRGLEACTMREDDVDAYRCDRRQDEDTSVQEDFGIDALLLLDIWATGTLVPGDALEMTTEIITDCQGSGCWLAALETGGFPCHSTVVVTAVPLP
jgi:hypothetical protein